MERRKIAYYGTLGPACCEEEILYQMFLEGMTGIRLNLSHTGLKSCKEWIENVKMAGKRAGITPEFLIDLQGPELRIGVLKDPILLKEGKEYILATEETKTGKDDILVPKDVLQVLTKGQAILLDDGKILLEVCEMCGKTAKAVVKRGGMLQSRKSIALPDRTVPLPVLTKNDLENIRCAKQFGVTAVMLPFVRSGQDILSVRRVLRETGNEHIAIFAKIENLQGVENIEEIVKEADQIVVARGDLGNAVPLWELPAIQKRLSDQCLKAKKPFMIVTQMLHSMTHSKVPTRAEVSDIFHAILDGASSVMVTGETATGEYPVEVIKYLVRTGNTAMIPENLDKEG